MTLCILWYAYQASHSHFVVFDWSTLPLFITMVFSRSICVNLLASPLFPSPWLLTIVLDKHWCDRGNCVPHLCSCSMRRGDANSIAGFMHVLFCNEQDCITLQLHRIRRARGNTIRTFPWTCVNYYLRSCQLMCPPVVLQVHAITASTS